MGGMADSRVVVAVVGVAMVVVGALVALWQLVVARRDAERRLGSREVAAGRVVGMEFDTYDDVLVVPIDVRRVTAEFCDLSGGTHLVVTELPLVGRVFREGDVVEVAYEERDPAGTAAVGEGADAATPSDASSRTNARIGVLVGVGLMVAGSATVVLAGFGA